MKRWSVMVEMLEEFEVEANSSAEAKDLAEKEALTQCATTLKIYEPELLREHPSHE